MNATTDRPWMTALEMQFSALRNARKLIATGVAVDSISDRMDHDAVDLLPSCVPFAWSRDVAKAVWLASRTIPEDALLDQRVLSEGVRSAWWWFDAPLPIPMDHAPDVDGLDTKSISGLVLHCQYDPRVLLVMDVRMTEFGAAVTGFSAFPFGHTLGEIVRGQRVSTDGKLVSEPSQRMHSLVRFILAAAVWLDQRILTLGHGHVERHRRKQLARENDVPPPTDVRVIQLRRFESESHAKMTDSESVDWSCRWIVNGHWRNQPYKDTRKLIYIMPHVKGPDDKPLKVPTHTVYSVSR